MQQNATKYFRYQRKEDLCSIPYQLLHKELTENNPRIFSVPNTLQIILILVSRNVSIIWTNLLHNNLCPPLSPFEPTDTPVTLQVSFLT